MPVAAGPQAYHSQLPSFMSVYSCNAPDMDNTFVESPQQSEVAASAGSPQGGDSAITGPDQQHKHRDSTSTQASESTDSSPTTTISTADSSALTDPSPSSSPESPVIILPLSSFSSSGGFGIHSLDDLTMSDNPIISDSFDRPMTSPLPRKPRNAKGLALKLGSLEPLLQVSAPASPAAFVKPPLPKPRKKPSNLSLQTTSNFGANASLALSMEPPPTPSALRVTMLHHAASTSDMGMFSPDPRGLSGPQGGMRLPGFERSQISGLSNAFRKPTPILESRSPGSQNKIEEISPIRTQLATRSGGDIGGDTFDCAANEDAKSPGYPDGPIAIYEPYVFLYLEPTAEEASEFDVVMNVASEVKNPFKAKQAPEKQESPNSVPPRAFDAMDVDRESPAEPMTAASIATFSTAFETQPTDASATPTETSPTTPKPISKEPEYIHVPWEHNTDISNDLLGLCETIDDRVSKGKKVLVHCQQGASRSASLIIAYGMYRNPSLTVDAAYNAAQDKSKYVSPNINLMYALQDFRKTLQARLPKVGRSPAKHRMALSVDEIDFSVKDSPRTAPLPLDPNGRISPVGTPPHARGNSTPNLRELSPGPSSAPSFPWPSGDSKSMLHSDSDSASKLRPPGFDFGETDMLKMAPLSDSAAKPRFTTFDFPPAMSKPPTFPEPQSSFAQAPLDTPPNSQPASPPSLRGFAAHRDERTAKRKPAPSLNFKPAQPLRPAPSLPILPSKSVIRPAYPPPTIPSPTLWSPRLPEIPAPKSALWSPRLPLSSFLHHQSIPPAPTPAPAPAPLPQLSIDSSSDDVPPTPTLMSPRVGDFGINPFAEVFAANPATERLQQAPGFRKKKSFVFQKADLALAMEKPLPELGGREKPLPPLPVESGTPVEVGGGGVVGDGNVGVGVRGGGEEGRRTGPAMQVVDPRSPGLFGEGMGVVRSIDDVL